MEPIFNNKGVPPEMLKEWLDLLCKRNAEAVQAAQPVQGASIMLDSVQFLFLTCDRLKMSSEVKYLSLELFDRFMLRHIQDLHTHVMNSGTVKTRGREWQEIKKRVSNQVVLRIVSCVQIASKLTSHYRILSPNKARRFLMDSGHRYNTESILQSELRILKTLSFCVSVPSPLVYLESLLEALVKTDESIDVMRLHGLSLSLLDMVYLQYNEVYDKLHQVASCGSPITDNDKDKFACVRADKMLLLVTIITAASYILDRNSHDKVMQILCKVSRIPEEDSADFTSIILQMLMQSNED